MLGSCRTRAKTLALKVEDESPLLEMSGFPRAVNAASVSDGSSAAEQDCHRLWVADGRCDWRFFPQGLDFNLRIRLTIVN